MKDDGWPIHELDVDAEGKIKSFTVRRSRWYFGHGPQYTLLMRRSDHLCDILGCYALACGLPSEEIIGLKSIEDIAKLPKEMEWLLRPYSPMFILADIAAAFNDYVQTVDNPLDREAELNNFFQQHARVTVLFVD